MRHLPNGKELGGPIGAGAFFAHLAFDRARDHRSRLGWSLLVFALLAGGFLTKGPVAVVPFCLPVSVRTLAVVPGWKVLGLRAMHRVAFNQREATHGSPHGDLPPAALRDRSSAEEAPGSARE